MHPKSDHRSEYVKFPDQSYEDDNPVMKRLDASGYDFEDLASITCIEKRKLVRIAKSELVPTTREMSLIESAFLLVHGTLKEEYAELEAAGAS